MSTWYTHFKKLFEDKQDNDVNQEEISNIFTEVKIYDGPFTEDEYKKAKAALKPGKSAGPDNIPSEVVKYCHLDEMILDMCNAALLKNQKPSQWSLSNIIPVPKKGDLSSTDNYRGISLMCIIAKLYNRMILFRIRKELDPKLRINQNGFRPKRTTVEQILALKTYHRRSP